ncbi:MAG: response regulator transcription factor [Oscillochloris sp.]|nr:response regulator transcription factor [Oscillochloris sp.]
MPEFGLISVLLAAAHPLVRRALQAAIDNEPDIRIIAEAPDGRSVVRLVHQLCPDVLVLDMAIEDYDALALIADVHRSLPKTRIVAVADHDATPYLFQTMRNGAAGFVPKGTGITPLLTAIRIVAAGDVYLCPPWNEQTLRAHHGAPGIVAGLTALTPREREVLRLLGRGLNCATVAAQLGIGGRTAETLCQSMMRKLNLLSQADLIHYARRVDNSEA